MEGEAGNRYMYSGLRQHNVLPQIASRRSLAMTQEWGYCSTASLLET